MSCSCKTQCDQEKRELASLVIQELIAFWNEYGGYRMTEDLGNYLLFRIDRKVFARAIPKESARNRQEPGESKDDGC